MHASVTKLVLAAWMLAASGPAQPPAPTTQPQRQWGPAKAGLQLALTLKGAPAVGGTLRLGLAIRNVGAQAVSLAGRDDVVGWVLIAQSRPEGRKGLYSHRVRPARGLANWPEQLAGGEQVEFPTIDLSDAPGYHASAARALLEGFLTGKEDAELPAPGGKLPEMLAPGKALAKFTLCLPRKGDRPLLLRSATLEFQVAPPKLSSLSPRARKAFVAELIRRFHRDAWSAQDAHGLAVTLGPDVVADLIRAVKNLKAPGHARMWMATALADIRDERGAAALAELLADRSAGVRHVVAYHGPKQRSAKLDRAIVAKAKAGSQPRLTAWGLLGFLVFRASVPAELLEAGLDSPDPRARATAAKALTGQASHFNLSRLVDLLKDADPRVRAASARVLGKMGNRSSHVVGALIAALDRPGELPRQRICAALSALTGKDLPYDPQADEQARQGVLKAWRQHRARTQPAKP